MPTSVINEPDLALDRHDGNIFVITMRKGPENRLNSAYCQRLIAAFNLVRTTLGPDSEGAVITKGNDAKFWCTVSFIVHLCQNRLFLQPILIQLLATLGSKVSREKERSNTCLDPTEYLSQKKKRDPIKKKQR
jgi:hypothetical protein